MPELLYIYRPSSLVYIRRLSNKSRTLVPFSQLYDFGGAESCSVAFVSGSGVCNGLSLDMLILAKKLKSLNNDPAAD